MRYLIGIDEAGRGPLAGPVAVGVLAVPLGFDWELIPGVGDSKAVSPKNREAIFRLAYVLKKAGQLDYSVRMIGASTIDRLGISRAVQLGIHRALQALADRSDLSAENVHIKLDGSLKAPTEFVYQETIIKGDASEPVIGLASILAKVTRDNYMRRLARRTDLAAYQFHLHKGYGTKKHREIIAKIGLSSIHRQSFCRHLLT